MQVFRLCSLALALASAFAFQASLPVRAASKKSSTRTIPPLALIMSDQEQDAILRTIEDCAEHTQCGVDDVSGLLYELHEQQAEMEARLDQLATIIAQLKELNETTDDRHQVRALVRDMLRVFAVGGGPAFPVTGFAGDIGKGPMTAYDALPPKKWKPNQA